MLDAQSRSKASRYALLAGDQSMDQHRAGSVDYGPGTLHRTHAVQVDLDPLAGRMLLKLAGRLFQPFLFFLFRTQD